MLVSAQGILSKGAVSAKHRSKALSTARRAMPGSLQCGFMLTDSSARRRTQLWCCPLMPKFPRNSSCLKWQSPLRLAARTCTQPQINTWALCELERWC